MEVRLKSYFHFIAVTLFYSRSNRRIVVSKKIIKGLIATVIVMSGVAADSAFAKTKYTSFYVRNCAGRAIEVKSYNGADGVRLTAVYYDDHISNTDRAKFKCDTSGGKCWLRVRKDTSLRTGVWNEGKVSIGNDITITKANDSGFSVAYSDKGSDCN